MSRSADTPFASPSHRLTTNVVWQYKCVPIVEWVRAVASKQDLSLFQVSGEPYDIGYRLGEIARPVFTEYMEQSSAWQAVRRWHAISSHANHLIHPGCEAEAQIVTDSSHDRQTRVEHLLPRLASPITPAALLDVLQDRAPAGLQACRSTATTRSIPTTKTRSPRRSSTSAATGSRWQSIDRANARSIPSSHASRPRRAAPDWQSP